MHNAQLGILIIKFYKQKFSSVSSLLRSPIFEPAYKTHKL